MLFCDILEFTVKSSYVGGTGQVSDDELQYDPAMAGTWPLNDSPTAQENINADKSVPPKNKEDDEIYDPESANFSPEDEPSSSQSPSNLSMSEKMARTTSALLITTFTRSLMMRT